MSRLTEREIDLIRAARYGSLREPASAADVIQEARRLQSETLGRLLVSAAAAVAKWTGLAALTRALDQHVWRKLRAAMRRRRAISELRRLDDHLLSDIGLERGQVESYVEELSPEVFAPSRSAPTPTKGIGHWLERRRSIRELEALDDRQLADIGLLRREIPEAVEQAMARKALHRSRVSAAQVQGLTQQALGSVPPMQRRRADRAVATAKPMAPVLPLWIGPWLDLSRPGNAH